MARKLHPGMGQAVGERTVLRKKEVGGQTVWEDWGDVAHRVALGNSLLAPEGERQAEYEAMHRHLANATLLMSGRHLQHGDETQPSRNMECYTNCSTSSSSFLQFYLLMNGSGVGRCYDDDMMLVDWDNAPTVRCVLDSTHPDFDYSAHESVRDARHKYGSGRDVKWFEVPDTREGWAKALETWEVAAFEKIHKDKLLILDFSGVRCKGSPIRGMQGRPASGPVPLMNAFAKSMTIRGAGLDEWLQAIYIDHYFAECVMVGGARRAARMATKWWRDRNVLDFITIKRPIEYTGLGVEQITELRKSLTYAPMGFLWSSNNSITVDREFWELVGLTPESGDRYFSDDAVHARAVFNLATAAAYGDGTGEPGFINADKLNRNPKGLDKLGRGEYVHSDKYQVNEDSQIYLDRLFKRARKKKTFMIVNPCVTADTWVHTTDGPRQVADLVDQPFTALVNGKPYQATGFWETGEKEVLEIVTARGYTLRLTANHKVKVERRRRQRFHGGYNVDHEWVEAGDLKPGDKVVLHNHRGASWSGEGNFSLGWIVGNVLGDGGHNPESYPTYVRFWGETAQHMTEYAVKLVRSLTTPRSDFHGGVWNEANQTMTTSCAGLNDLVTSYLVPRSKDVTPAVERASSEFYRGFIRGLFDADGTVGDSTDKGLYVRLAQSKLSTLQVVQRMLARLGIASTIYPDRQPAGDRTMPDGKGGSKPYRCEATHELHVSRDNLPLFATLIGFEDPLKQRDLEANLARLTRGPYAERFTAKVTECRRIGRLPVFDCSVEDIRAFDANGLYVHNCGEIPLAVWGGFCTLADVVPYHADSLDEAEEAFRVAARSLVRVNTMDSIYGKEVRRTNRIGVGITGLHEFAWKFFSYGFRDLIDEEKTKDFWMAIARFKRAVQEEARNYSDHLGVVWPDTDNCLKPAGTTSKIFGLTEAAHLPAMVFYLRWVQFNVNNPLVEKYRKAGYPCRELRTYENTVIIGFPTSPVLSTLGLGDKLVTAGEATPEEQYRWLMLLEKYWLRGVTEDGEPLPDDTGGQISMTIKYDRKAVSYEQFVDSLLRYQSQVKCCSVMPQEDTSSYEYLPEEAVTKAQYEAIQARIREALDEDIAREHVDCAGGACPIDFTAGEKENRGAA